MDKQLMVLAWTSFIVSTIYFIILSGIIFLAAFSGQKITIKIGNGFFVLLAMFVWPIIYYFT